MNEFEKLEALCAKHTHLTEADIDKLRYHAEIILSNNIYEDSDVFINVIDVFTGEAIVIFQRGSLTRKSLYSKNIVGEKAERKNEPAVYRTFVTSLNTIGLLARSQENVMLRQKVYPIFNDKQNIGVIIIEDAADENDFWGGQNKYKEEGDDEIFMRLKASLVENINEGIMIFNSKGYLVQMNQALASFYHDLGYWDDILGMHYDNLSLDNSTFFQLSCRRKTEGNVDSFEKNIQFGNAHFQTKYIFVDNENILMLIINDISEVKRKEEEISIASFAIREIHHRVKNNLQSVVSLLRIQARRCASKEARKALTESVYRIMAIARTHEILSKELADNISLGSVLASIIDNMRRCYIELDHITIKEDIEPGIVLRSDVVVTIALITNELIQNCFDHAFANKSQGTISVRVYEENELVHIKIIDDGTGYNQLNKAGNNLGLQIVNSYIKEKLGGKLFVSSNEAGTKTNFYFHK